MNSIAPTTSTIANKPKSAPHRSWEKESHATQQSLFTSLVTSLNSTDRDVIALGIRALSQSIQTYGHEPIRPSLFSEPPLRFSTGVILGQIPISFTAKEMIREAARRNPDLQLDSILQPTSPEQLTNIGENVDYLETRQTYQEPNLKKAEFARWANAEQERDEEGSELSIYEKALEDFLAPDEDETISPSCLDRVGTNAGFQEIDRHSGEHVGLRPAVSRNRFDLIRSLASQPNRIRWAASGAPSTTETWKDIQNLRAGVRTANKQLSVPRTHLIATNDESALKRSSREIGAALALLNVRREPGLRLLGRCKADLGIREIRNRIETDHNPGRVLAKSNLTEKEESILPAELRESILIYGARREAGAFQKMVLEQPEHPDVKAALTQDAEACQKLMPNWIRLNNLDPDKAATILQREGESARERIRVRQDAGISL